MGELVLANSCGGSRPKAKTENATAGSTYKFAHSVTPPSALLASRDLEYAEDLADVVHVSE